MLKNKPEGALIDLVIKCRLLYAVVGQMSAREVKEEAAEKGRWVNWWQIEADHLSILLLIFFTQHSSSISRETECQYYFHLHFSNLLYM